VESMIVLLAVEFLGEARLLETMCACGVKSAEDLEAAGLNRDLTVQNPVKFLTFNLPYKLVPILLAVRVWRPKPFSRKG